jgi:hypothetical protein
MKRLSLLAALAVFLISCGGTDKSDDNGAGDPLEDSTATAAEDEALIQRAADNLIGQFSDALIAEVGAAIESHGYAGAVGHCNTLAPALADSHSVGSWSIRRVSEKNRNPDNRPTLEEKAVLAAFSDTLAEPADFVGRWQETDSTLAYQYYRPIRIQPLCMKCHGSMQTLAPGVFDAVKRHYPGDRATGYRIGDLRGMFVVEARWPEGRSRAEELTADSTRPTEAL